MLSHVTGSRKKQTYGLNSLNKKQQQNSLDKQRKQAGSTATFRKRKADVILHILLCISSAVSSRINVNHLSLVFTKGG